MARAEDTERDVVEGYEKDLDWGQEVSYVKRHVEDYGRITQVHAERAPGGWWVHVLETDRDGDLEIASVDLGTHPTRQRATRRLIEFIENNPLGLSPSTDYMLANEAEAGA